jgi:hypothetical protein
MVTLTRIGGFGALIVAINPGRIDIHVGIPGTNDVITFLTRDARAKADDDRHFRNSVRAFFS